MVLGELLGGAAEETFGLVGDPLKNWLLNSVSPAMYAAIPGATMLQDLRNNGMAIATQAFYDIRASVLYQADLVSGLRRDLTSLAEQNPDSLIPLGYTAAPPNFQISDNFLYRFAIESTNPETGETNIDFMAVSSDRQLTYTEAAFQMGTMFTGEYVEKGYEVSSIKIDAAFSNKFGRK